MTIEHTQIIRWELGPWTTHEGQLTRLWLFEDKQCFAVRLAAMVDPETGEPKGIAAMLLTPGWGETARVVPELPEGAVECMDMIDRELRALWLN